MKLAIDSSSLAKRYVREAGSDELDVFLKSASKLAFCVILVPEIVSALNLRLREQCITSADYRAAKKQLLDDVGDATVLQITPSAISRTVKLLESNVLRAMDALHVACALEWQADIFLTSDKRQLAASTNAGLRSEYIGTSMR
ncbi:MAG: type II toxin-antitoxin system VapC family toxin [Desulfofustis sp. PB-SRB1]|mgnify:CR=1 FL=1|jgi:predicted nucleic acid-binding protein|nr:type II toxin-antitoxin system VapC family toxin [Desulfofustis sp. PB-SRB1]MBL0382458.1 type II toxin-antitoxin system VapC family toxin [Desulfofustis sp. PB-SRB1]MBM1004080.1 type II toxin-antitoxin system VapC family toxin [Desulfofustis sp. PB-SRB1]HBH28203.1 PIN domain-containing protein [Desulfofustis sp.]HBH30634.1 PIN domain-containing protein [Desulfofustis sp.]